MSDETKTTEPQNQCDAPKQDRFERQASEQRARERRKREAVYTNKSRSLIVNESETGVIFTLTSTKTNARGSTFSTLTMNVAPTPDDEDGIRNATEPRLTSVVHNLTKRDRRANTTDRSTTEWKAENDGVFNITHSSNGSNPDDPSQVAESAQHANNCPFVRAFDPKAVLVILLTRDAEQIATFLERYLPFEFCFGL